MNNKWEESKVFFYDMLNNVEKKTEKFIDVQKERYTLSKLKDELNCLYIELGKYEYSIKNNITTNISKEKLISKIDVVLKKIIVVEERLNHLKNVKICSNCGYINKDDAKYCSGCSLEL